jgi:CBS domain containing-hemolysin-like protein
MSLWVRLVAPLRWLVRQLSESITTLVVGEERTAENILRVDELRTLVEEVVESGELHAVERALIDKILAAGSTEVRDIMLPRTRVVFIDGDRPLPEIVTEVRRLRHRQLPVFRGDHDNVVGMLYAEDLARELLEGKNPADLALAPLLRPVAAVPATKMIDDLFGFFLVEEARAAVVVDEFGGVEGLVTLGDLIAFVFGRDARADTPDQAITEVAAGAWEVDGALKIEKFNSLLKREGKDRRFTTVAGFILHRLDRRPEIGDRVAVGDTTLRIIAMEGLRIARVRIETTAYEAVPEAAAADAAEAKAPAAGESDA